MRVPRGQPLPAGKRGRRLVRIDGGPVVGGEGEGGEQGVDGYEV